MFEIFLDFKFHISSFSDRPATCYMTYTGCQSDNESTTK